MSLPKLNEVDKRIWRELGDGEFVTKWWCDDDRCCRVYKKACHSTFSQKALPSKTIRVVQVGTNRARNCEFSFFNKHEWTDDATS